MEQKHYFTDEKNAQIVVALLKAHGIRKVVLCPGTANIAFSGGIQGDPWFQAFSAVDERHAAYLAVGMSSESGEPVVLSCTGATSSRNFLPALTEAYYRHLPILAVTSSHPFACCGNMVPQMIDRTTPPKDAVRYSYQCRVPHGKSQIDSCVLEVNKAILELSRHGGGPVHINLETEYCYGFSCGEEQCFRKICRIDRSSIEWPQLDTGTKVMVWIGSHSQIQGELEEVLVKFVQSQDAAVLVDKTSGYHGAGAVDATILCMQNGMSDNPTYQPLKPDLLIHIGEISGDYDSMALCRCAKEVWRVNEDGEIRDLFGKLKYVFEMPEVEFFRHYVGDANKTSYSTALLTAVRNVRAKIPDLPFSNIWMASRLCAKLPVGSRLHLGILNSLRSWNGFEISDDIYVNSNVGGFGIDGCLSTMIGAAIVSPDKLFFGVFGDLSFFYDMNALGNRHLGKNVRILLVNNGCGAEFNLYNNPGIKFGDEVNDYIAAGRHFANKSRELVRHYAVDLGFKYLSASSKEEFQSQLCNFINPETEGPVLFECFTAAKDESDALRLMKSIDEYVPSEYKPTFGDELKGMIPRRVKNIIKAAIR